MLWMYCCDLNKCWLIDDWLIEEKNVRQPQHKTISSTDAKKTRATHLEVSQGHQTYTIPYVRNSFLLCNSNFVFKMSRF